MLVRWKPLGGLFLLLGLTGLFAPSPTSAQTPWANSDYKYRRPVTVQNATGTALATGDMATYSFIPQYGPLANQSSSNGLDAKIYYFNGTTNVDVPQALLPMGSSAAKILFQLQAPLAATSYLTEDQNAGASSYASLPAGTKLTFSGSQDDNTTVVTLPFQFPFKNGTTNQLLVAIDGYLAPGATDPGRPDNPATAGTKNEIIPWSSDFAITDASTLGVYYAADATQAVIRWEVQESASGPLIAKFAAVLKPDGSIRFVYGNPAGSPSAGIADPNTTGSYSPIKYGVAVGDTSFSIIHAPTFPADFSNHADILYTQNLNLQPTTSTGYYIYYGNLTDNGTTGRTQPPADKLVAYTFDDGTTQGWGPVSANTETALVEATTLSGQKVLHMQGTRTAGHPAALAKTQTAMLGDALVYGRVTATGGQEVGVGSRGDDTGHGYFNVLDGFGSEESIVERTTPGESHDYNQISNFIGFVVQTWSYDIMRVTGTGANITIQGRAFVDGAGDPGAWQVTGTPNAQVAQFDTGALCLTGWEGGASDQYMDWVYSTNANAELPTYAYGAEEVSPPPAGKGSLVVTVTDAATTAPIANATVTLTPTGGGSPLVVTTNNKGIVDVPVDPGTYSVQVASNNYTGQTATSSAVTVGGITNMSFALIAPELITNGSFETPDPTAPSVKPLGWFRRDYSSNGANPIPDPNAANLPYVYNTDAANAHTGTHSVGFSGSSNIASWEQEGSVPGSVNTDNRGKGPLIPVKNGETYKVSVWFKKPASANGKLTLRIRFCSADDPNTLIAGGSTDDLGQSANFVQVTRIITAPSDGYMQVRIYGTDVPTGEFAYADDVSAIRISTPTFRGVVHDSNGNPIPNIGVGIHEANGAGLADPIAAATTDGAGRFAISFLPTAGTSYVVQAWKDGYAASANFPLAASTAVTDVTYDPKPVIDIALRKTVVVSTGDDGSNSVTNALDGNEGTRWASSDQNPIGSWASKQPSAFIIDLGQTIDFSKIAQVSIIWENAIADHYMLRVGNTDPTTTVTDAASAASYGTLLYDSPTNAGDRSWNRSTGDHADVISAPSLAPVSGRYIEVYMDKFYQLLGNYSIYEFKVETAVANVTGKVVNTSGQGVAGAGVGAGPDAASYAITDAAGNFTLPLPVGLGSFSLVAHKVDSGDTVYPVSAPVSITPSAGGGTVPTLVLGAAVPNVVPKTSAADTVPSGVTDTGSAATNVVDHDLTTRWVTFPLGSSPISPTNPLGFVIDMGSAQTINEIVISWEAAYAGAYSVELSTDGTTYHTVYQTTSASGGYPYTASGGTHTADAITFPAQSARYIQLTFTQPGPVSDRVSIWEVQAANVTASQPLNGQDVLTALRIAGGLQQASSADKTRLDANGDNKVDILDAVTISRHIYGL